MARRRHLLPSTQAVPPWIPLPVPDTPQVHICKASSELPPCGSSAWQRCPQRDLALSAPAPSQTHAHLESGSMSQESPVLVPSGPQTGCPPWAPLGADTTAHSRSLHAPPDLPPALAPRAELQAPSPRPSCPWPQMGLANARGQQWGTWGVPIQVLPCPASSQWPRLLLSSPLSGLFRLGVRGLLPCCLWDPRACLALQQYCANTPTTVCQLLLAGAPPMTVQRCWRQSVPLSGAQGSLRAGPESFLH